MHRFAAASIAALLTLSGVALGSGPEDGADASQTWSPSPVWRVGGEPEHEVESREIRGTMMFRAGPVRTDTALPVGYPRPTAPEAIEIKHFPSVRRAEIRGGGGRDDGMYGFNTTRAFWPLFNHIKKRDIAMTTPVEMDYEGVDLAGDMKPEGWSMSFLYRTPELGPTGSDGDVVVYDTEPVTVLALGVRGDMSRRDMERGFKALAAWLEEHPEWEVAGDPRTFGYNGPNIASRNRWHEVQVPIRPAVIEDEAVASGG
ncbi:MAG: heme-binding protein [Phycisphaerales bacterium JB037]